MPSVLLRTARLVLRPFRADDIDAFARFVRDEVYRRFLGSDHPGPEQFVENNLGSDGAWVIELDDTVVGSIFLGDELACLLDPAVHRRGIAVEAATAVITDGFTRRGYEVITARADAQNSASLGLLARLGFERTSDGGFELRSEHWQPQQEPS